MIVWGGTGPPCQTRESQDLWKVLTKFLVDPRAVRRTVPSSHFLAEVTTIRRQPSCFCLLSTILAMKCSGNCSEYESFRLLMRIDAVPQAETGQYDAE